MPHFGELVGIVFGEDSWECPFPHEKEERKDYDNVFKGDGGELGKKMESGDQTIVNEEMGGGKKIDAILRPSQDTGNKNLDPRIYQDDKPIKLGGLPGSTGATFPLTCAAHHLIPAQASLKDSELVKYLFKGTAQFKKGQQTVSKGGGKLEKNIGYDINGSQNGVWLPGPYALRAGKGKPSQQAPLKRRRRAVTVTVEDEVVRDPDGEDAPSDGLDLADAPSGAKHTETQTVSFYFLYTVAASLMAYGQYHDSHGDYSDFVQKSLNTIATEMQVLAYEGQCGKCPKREKDDPLPPPYPLTKRLNSVSHRLKRLLSGPPGGWHPGVVTSKYAKKFMQKEFRGLTLRDVESDAPDRQ